MSNENKVVLPEHAAVVTFEWRKKPDVKWLIDTVVRGTKLYTEQQVRALLATATGLPAQAVETGEVLGWVHKRNGKIGHHFYTYEPHCDSSVRDDGGEKIAVIAASSAAPQAQADARDAESDYQRGYRHGYNRRDAEVQGALL